MFFGAGFNVPHDFGILTKVVIETIIAFLRSQLYPPNNHFEEKQCRMNMPDAE